MNTISGRRALRSLAPVLIVAAIAAAGTLYLLLVQGATSRVILETERGTVTAPARVVADSAASSGSAVVFGGAGSMAGRFPGDPHPLQSGKAYFGSSVGGNGDPSIRHERPAGKSLSVRRTFFQWSDHEIVPNDKLYITVRADHTANRLPYISTKAPPWQEVANGLHDARIDQLLRELDSYGSPVWLTFHHEPEGGGGVNHPDDPGGAAAWRGMQTKVRSRMTTLGTKHIAFMPTLMAYTWSQQSGRNPEDWWVPGIWDAYMVDHYQEDATKHMVVPPFTTFASWANTKNIPFGIGEWGNRGTDSAAAQDMQDFWDWSFRNKQDMVAYSYFDSGLNSPNGSWELTGEPLLKFHEILGQDPRVMRIDQLGR